MKPRREWHRAFFRSSFYNPASRTAVARAPAEASFILKSLKLRKGASLLDLCCGPGRHSVEFARRGLEVTGLDFSADYLREAAERARKKKVGVRLVRGDMRRLEFRGEFDAAVNLFTSFGYFQKFSDDLRVLKGVASALKPGGLFFIDVINGAFVRRNFRPRSWEEMEDHFLLQSSELASDGVNNTWLKVAKKGGGRSCLAFFTRLYDRKKISDTLLRAGLRPLRFWGSFRGDPLSDGRDRLLCLAKKIRT